VQANDPIRKRREVLNAGGKIAFTGNSQVNARVGLDFCGRDRLKRAWTGDGSERSGAEVVLLRGSHEARAHDYSSRRDRRWRRRVFYGMERPPEPGVRARSCSCAPSNGVGLLSRLRMWPYPASRDAFFLTVARDRVTKTRSSAQSTSKPRSGKRQGHRFRTFVRARHRQSDSSSWDGAAALRPNR
jgi:hypothetical protein